LRARETLRRGGKHGLVRALASAAIAACLFVAAGGAGGFAADGESVPDGVFTMYDEGEYSRFVNYTDGYSLLVDRGMDADMDMAGVRAALEGPDKRIEIFSQALDGISGESYRAYSNGFLNNWSDHRLEYEGTQEIGGHSVHVTLWSRGRLARVENDKNYYACLDVYRDSGEMLTIMLSSAVPIHEAGGYAYLAEGLTFIDKTGPAYIRKATATSAFARGWNPETKAWFEQYFGEESGLSWGIYEPKAPHEFQDLRYLEKVLEFNFPVILNYTNFENASRHADLELRLANAHEEGRTLELTLQTYALPTGQANMVYQALNGVYDEFLRNYARTVAEFGHPVLFRLGNEMNGDWCAYSGYNTSRDPRIFVEFYRYVYSFFEDAGADNVIWVWNPNGKSFPDFSWNDELMYYPGDEYVDVVGMTLYNTGSYYQGESWSSFAELYDGLYRSYVERYGKPLMITEFASARVGGDKQRWVEDMLARIGDYDRIKMAVWWDGADFDSDGRIARSYYIDDPPTLIRTFRDYLNGTWDPQAVHDWKEDTFA
jgi:hypothetical protein